MKSSKLSLICNTFTTGSLRGQAMHSNDILWSTMTWHTMNDKVQNQFSSDSSLLQHSSRHKTMFDRRLNTIHGDGTDELTKPRCKVKNSTRTKPR